MRRAIVGVLIGVGFVAAIVVATFDQMRATCEVCMVYRGHEICETAVAVDRGQAQMQATSTACAQLSTGVTDGIQCNGTRPKSVECEE